MRRCLRTPLVGLALTLAVFFWGYLCLAISCWAGAGTGGVLSASISAGEGKTGWAQEWLAAREQVRAGNYPQAQRYLRRLLERYPTLIQPRWEYVQILLHLQKLAEAQDNMELLFELDETRCSYRLVLGSLVAGRGQYQRAISLMSSCWQDGDNPFARGWDLYRSLAALGQRAEALVVLEGLHRLQPENLTIRKRLFSLYIDLGKDQQAQPLAASLASEQDPELLLAIARLHMRLGLNLLAAEYWQQLLRLEPGNLEAHRFLATNFLSMGREMAALPHLRRLLEAEKKNVQVARQIGLIYFHSRKYHEASVFLTKFLAAYPDDSAALLLLARCYVALELDEQAAVAYRHYLELVPLAPGSIRLQAAEVFSAAGHDDLAIAQYKILEQDNPKGYIQPLARLLTRVQRPKEALAYWLRFAEQHPADTESRRAAVDLLAGEPGAAERLDLLRQLHNLLPGDIITVLQLVQALIVNQQDEEAWRIFAPLVDRELFSPALQRLRGQMFLHFRLYGHAYKDLRESLVQEDSFQARLALLQVAGEMGQLEEVRRQVKLLLQEGSKSKDFLMVRLRAAQALAAAGDEVAASGMYQGLLAEEKYAFAIHMSGAAHLADFDLLFGAEQQLRLALSGKRNDKVVLALVDLMLAQHHFQAAEEWLKGVSLGNRQRLVHELRILNGYDQGEDVLDKAGEILANNGDKVDSREILIQEARAYLSLGQGDISRDMLLQLIAADRYYAPAYIELVYLYEKLGERHLALQAGEEAVTNASYDAGLLKQLLEASRQAGLLGLACQSARSLVQKYPNSFGFRLQLIGALIRNGEYDEAFSQWRTVAAQHGQESMVVRLGARIALAQGRYKDGLALLAQKSKLDLAEQVIRARLLWGDNQWDMALKEYKNILDPPAGVLFQQRCDEQGISLPLAPKRSVWARLVPLSDNGEIDPLQRVLKPSYALGEKGGEVNKVSALSVESFRWQQDLEREYIARRAVQRREYFHAVRQYEVLLGQGKTDAVLAFDLAGVYSQLGRIGDEAMMYETVQQWSPDFPGLKTAMLRNHLKRQPRGGVHYSFRQEEGWAGHKDIAEKRFGLHGWLSLRPRDQLEVRVDRLRYKSVVGRQEGRYANELTLSYQTTFFDHLRFLIKGGTHGLNDGAKSTIYQIRVTGLAGDRFAGYIDFGHKLVTDTMESVKLGIGMQNYEAGARIDLLPRLQVGGRLFHLAYSDDNQQNGYGVDVGYILLPDPDFVRISFIYDYTDSQDHSQDSEPIDGLGLVGTDRPYWAPANYWRNDFSLYYKHRFSEDVLGRAMPGFISAECRFGHDSTDQSLYFAELVAAKEMNKAWLLKLRGSTEESNEYRAKKVMAEVSYRW